jgi:acetolactate synthase I/II/III large subunit
MVKNSDILAQFLKHKEIDTVFGIIGSANAHIFDSIFRLGYTKIVCVHHEQAAVMAAGSYYRSSGKVSAALVTAGAGSSNAITGVLSNWADSIPCMIISGQEKSSDVTSFEREGRRMYGIQGYDSPASVVKMTKLAKTVLVPENLKPVLEHAYAVAVHGRPGPVWVDVPSDIQSSMVEETPWKTYYPQENHVDFSEYVLKLLKNSKRPVIVAGHGIKLSGAKQEFRKMVDAMGIPVIQTWSSMDLLPKDHPLNFGKAGVMGQRSANFIIQNSDLVLSMGSRLSIFQTGYDSKDFAPNAKVVVVDVDPTEKKERVDYFIEEDCRAFIKSVLDGRHCSLLNSRNTEWLDYCCEMKNKYPLLMEEHETTDYINSYKFLDYIKNFLPDDVIITTDMGTALLSGFYMMELKENQQMFTSLGLGEMGFGLPSAVGASFAHPDRTILCLNCDGGMMMNLQELQTITANKLNVKIVVFNNDGYLMIKHTQNLLFKGRQTCVDQSNGVTVPDFSKVANAFDIPSYKVYLGDDIHDKWYKFMNTEGPCLLEVFMSPTQDFVPKVKPISVENGIVAGTLEEMTPLLPFDEIKQNMICGTNPKSEKINR